MIDEMQALLNSHRVYNLTIHSKLIISYASSDDYSILSDESPCFCLILRFSSEFQENSFVNRCNMIAGELLKLNTIFPSPRSVYIVFIR